MSSKDEREMKIADRLIAQQLLQNMHGVVDVSLTRKYISLMNDEFSKYENKVIIAQVSYCTIIIIIIAI